jgi:hypothetical protein
MTMILEGIIIEDSSRFKIKTNKIKIAIRILFTKLKNRKQYIARNKNLIFLN